MKKKKPFSAKRYLFLINLYEPIRVLWFFKTRSFLVYAGGLEAARKKLHQRYPNAEILSIAWLDAIDIHKIRID